MTALAIKTVDRSAAARKAWETMRARKAMLGTMVAAVSLAPAAPSVPAAKPAIVNVSTSADFAPRVYVEPELVAVTELQYVSLYLVDHPVVGNGQREFIVLAMSSKRVKLFYSPSLETLEVSREVYDRGHMPVPSRRFNRDRLAGLIRKRIALADRVNSEQMADVLSDGGADAQRVLELIEA
jgi:hypothetical protein